MCILLSLQFVAAAKNIAVISVAVPHNFYAAPAMLRSHSRKKLHHFGGARALAAT
jgi:hypothetical protein